MGLMKNTIRLGATFSTFADVVADPSSITLAIFEQSSGSVLVSLSGSSITRVSTGVYYYDYTVPLGTGNFIHEWSGTLEGSPIVNRGLVVREWLRV